MFLVRNIMRVNLGRRSETVGVIKELHAEMQKELGIKSIRILTGSIGPSDQTIVMEAEHENLASLEEEIEKWNNWPGMAKWGEKWGGLIVPGSTHIEIFRIQD